LFARIETKDNDKNNIQNILSRLKSGITNKGTFFGIISVSFDDFLKLYDGISALKKAGYKFYNYAQYLSREKEKTNKETLTPKNTANNKSKDKSIPAPKNGKKAK
jgi:hypothetical protein